MLLILTEEFTSNDNNQNYKKSVLSQNIPSTTENFTSFLGKDIFNNSEIPAVLVGVRGVKPADLNLSSDSLEKLSIADSTSGASANISAFNATYTTTTEYPSLGSTHTQNCRRGTAATPADKNAHATITPHSLNYKRIQHPRPQVVTFEKTISSSEHSMNQGLSRSWSMMDLTTPLNKSLRLRSGCEHLTCEEEELRDFYQSNDPSIDCDELEPEPPRPTRQQTARLRAGAPNNCPPPSPKVCLNQSSYGRAADQSSRMHNFSSYYAPPAMNGTFDQYSSIPRRQPPTMDPHMSPWSMPVAQISTSRPSTSTRYSQDMSSFMNESPRRNQYYPPTPPVNSTRYKGLPGQPLRIPGHTPQAMATQWITPPGKMPSSFGQQSHIDQARQSRWEPSSCPADIQRPLTCPMKDEADVCATNNVNLPCEGCENNEEKFSAPPRCKPLEPYILKRLSCDLPAFNIPRGLENDFVCAKRREQWDILVKDQNCPGAIQSTIDGMINFNAIAFDNFFGNTRLPDCLPFAEPITLLEAFYLRVNYDRCQVKKLEQMTFAREHTDDDDDEHKPPPPNDDCSIIEKCFKRKYPTELNKAIERLLKAEKGFNFQNPNPELPSMDMTLDKISTDLPGVPISIQAYTGTTKPRN